MLSAKFKPKRNSCSIARFPCDSTAFLFTIAIPRFALRASRGKNGYSLDVVVNQFFMKLFCTSDINVVHDCQLMFSFKLPREQLKERKEK